MCLDCKVTCLVLAYVIAKIHTAVTVLACVMLRQEEGSVPVMMLLVTSSEISCTQQKASV